MGLRLGSRRTSGSASPLGHGRRLAAHQGHADPLGFVLGLAILWVFMRTVWGIVTGG
jgi:hypothetical protein